MAKGRGMRVALVHDFLVREGGAEQVLSVLANMFPEAPIYTLVADFSRAGKRYGKRRVISSFLERFPKSTALYQWYLPLMPKAIESFDFSDYDLILASSSAFAKGIVPPANATVVCYCHTPTRYLWTDAVTYVNDLRVPRVFKPFIRYELSRLREWDYVSAQRPDVFLANSENVQRRIQKYYRRTSSVLYPPVAIDTFLPSAEHKQYFLAGGRIVAYKRFDLIVTAFNKLGISIKIFGDGPLKEKLMKNAKNNVEFLGWVNHDTLQKLYAGARAFINPQEEDFGITMVEALASGRPIIAFKGGGALEIVQEGVNGAFFEEQTWEALADTVVRFKPQNFNPQIIRESAVRFDTKTFKERLLEILKRL
jgi:glycosyltransferase involved in cell wall biosynthesis